jgi:drug/metabolite transporter (DMT)-like permease
MPTNSVVHPARAGGSRLTAALCLIAGVFVFSIQDVILKLMSGSYPMTQAVALRSFVSVPIMLAVVAMTAGGLRKLWTRRIGLHLLRSTIMLGAYTSYYLALPAMPLAAVVTLFFTGPLFITALSYPILGERVEARQVIAVIVGFAGVVVTYHPGVGLFDWASLLPVISAFAYGLSQTMARQIGGSESAPVMAFYMNLVYLVGALAMAAVFGSGAFAHEGMHPSLAFLLRPWTFGNPADLLILASCGAIAAAGTVLLTHAYRIAAVSFVAPFEYVGLIWAACWGYLFFGELPDLFMIAGAALIVGAGLYMLSAGRRRGA